MWHVCDNPKPFILSEWDITWMGHNQNLGLAGQCGAAYLMGHNQNMGLTGQCGAAYSMSNQDHN